MSPVQEFGEHFSEDIQGRTREPKAGNTASNGYPSYNSVVNKTATLKIHVSNGFKALPLHNRAIKKLRLMMMRILTALDPCNAMRVIKERTRLSGTSERGVEWGASNRAINLTERYAEAADSRIIKLFLKERYCGSVLSTMRPCSQPGDSLGANWWKWRWDGWLNDTGTHIMSGMAMSAMI